MTGTLRILLSESFRAFFLAAGLFAICSVSVWAVWLGIATGGGDIAPLPDYWHAHEMIFGYAAAAMAGFFLTAVPSWTGTPAARSVFIGLATAVWLAGRAAIGGANAIDPVVVAVADLAFLPILASKIASQLIRRPKPQNMMFLGLITIIWTGNLMFHLGAGGVLADGMQVGLRGGLLGFAAIIAVIGGRVTPAFTRNAMTRAGIEDALPRSRRMFEGPGIALAIATPLLFIAGAPAPVIGVVAILSGLFQFLRLSGWRTSWTLDQPILWSLHLGFAMLATGYLAVGAAQFELIAEITALHIVGIGAVGGMTLAVMSRAILGHAGMALKASRPTSIAYALVAIAALTRVAADYLPADLRLGCVILSAIAWVTAFVLFVAVHWPIISQPRPPRASPPGP